MLIAIRWFTPLTRSFFLCHFCLLALFSRFICRLHLRRTKAALSDAATPLIIFLRLLRRRFAATPPSFSPISIRQAEWGGQ